MTRLCHIHRPCHGASLIRDIRTKKTNIKEIKFEHFPFCRSTSQSKQRLTGYNDKAYATQNLNFTGHKDDN